MEYITPRSVSRLEQELAELEGKAQESLKEAVKEEIPRQEEAILSAEEETFKKRYSDLRRFSQKQTDDLKALQVKVEELSKVKPSVDLPTVEEAEQWAKENPKAAAIIRALANEQVVNTASKSDDVVAIRQELERNKQESRIKKIHPDFDEVTSDKDFHDWADTQTPSVQKLIFNGDADDVIWAVSLYKKENDTNKLNPNKEAAKSVSNKVSTAPSEVNGKNRFSESQVNKMTLQEYEKNETAIQDSMRNGNFVYDLSGGAR